MSKKTIYLEDAIDAVGSMLRRKFGIGGDLAEITLSGLPSAQPEWGKPVGNGRPLADSEVIPRLQAIKAQIGGSYAIDRSIEVLEGLQGTQPERQSGAWIEYIPEHGKCPFCGNQVDLLGGKANNFCGECGADMRAKEKDYDHERAVEQLEHDMLYEPTFNQDDGSM